MWESWHERDVVEREAQELLDMTYEQRKALTWEEAQQFVAIGIEHTVFVGLKGGGLTPYQALECVLVFAGFPMDRLYDADDAAKKMARGQ